MTNEQMDRAIAEYVGWKCVEVYEWDESTFPPTKLQKQFHIRDGEAVGIPPYSTDLNAMHEAEKVSFRSSTLWVDFAFNLLNVLQAADMSVPDGMTCLLQATAAQRAEAFLHTIGKYHATETLP